MPTFSGPGVHGKIIKIRPYEDEGNDTLLPLTDRQRGILLAMTEYLDWKTRWETLPAPLDDDDSRDAYVSDLKNRLMIMIDICERMITCITSNEDVINTLTAFMLNQIINNGDIRQAIQNITQQNVGEDNPLSSVQENMIYGKDECDLDALYGSLRFLVKWMHQNNVDFLEKLADGITPESINKVMGELFPGFQGDNLIAQTLVGAFTTLSGAVLTAYNANYDGAYEDELICELFCLAQPTCSISIETMYATFSTRLSAPVDVFTVFGNALSFATTGALTAPQYVDAMFFLQIGSFKFLGGFESWEGISPLVSAINQGWDDPSDDWTECDTCPEAWCRHISGDSLRDLFFAFVGARGPQAFWSGTGWVRNVETIESRITIGFNPPAAYNLTTIRVVNSESITNGDTNTKTLYGLNSSNVVVSTIDVSPADADVTFDVFSARQNWAVDCVSDASVEIDAAIAGGEITDIYISGYGLSPDWGEDCE